MLKQPPLDWSPLVSVIIPTYNRAQHVVEAIDSVRSQTYPNIEIIVVDDGSTDNTSEVLSAYGSDIRCVRQENAGVAAARNTGIKHANGELIGLLDSDDRWYLDKIEKQIPYFHRYENVGMVHAGRIIIDVRRNKRKAPELPAELLDAHDLLGKCTVFCSSVVFRREVLQEVGYFDEKFHGSEDWDLWVRMADRYVIVGYPEVLVEFKRNLGDNLTSSPLIYDNCLRVLDKHSNLHPGCVRCKEAIAENRARMSLQYYTSLCQRSQKARQDRHYLDALRLRLRAMRLMLHR